MGAGNRGLGSINDEIEACRKAAFDFMERIPNAMRFLANEGDESSTMNVTITNYTPDPIHHISRSAAICYGKSDDKPSRVRNCVKMGHTSVLEHASVSFLVDGISRACSHQLVRHRMASYLQESQRYNRYDLSGDDWYVMPESFDTDYEASGYDHRKTFTYSMRYAAHEYELCIASGMKQEDARYLLPEATKTRIAVTMNWREVFHFLDLRTDKAAQWEIRDMANALIEEMRNVDDLLPMVELWEETHER